MTPRPSTAASFKPSDIPRRVVDVPAAPRRPATESAASATPAAASSEQRRLIVGRDISLTGEITACDVLVVEGVVEAKLRDGRNIEVAETGLFKGSVEIDQADIAGRFDGDITVRGRLKLRGTARINGKIRYGEIEVEAGAELNGEISRYVAGDSAGTKRPEPALAAAD